MALLCSPSSKSCHNKLLGWRFDHIRAPLRLSRPFNCRNCRKCSLDFLRPTKSLRDPNQARWKSLTLRLNQ